MTSKHWSRFSVCLRLAAFAGAAGFVSSSLAGVGIATWNLAWMMDKGTHERWVKACKAVEWRTEADFKAAGLPVPGSLEGLPYCDVHSGIDFRKKTCSAELKTQLQNRPSLADSADKKCRESPDLADWKSYEIKIKTLKETFANLERDGVDMVALQEVSNEAAVQAILPPGWQVKTSASFEGTPLIPQHVGVAWNANKLTATHFQLLMGLSALGKRPLRPGLQLTVQLDGMPVDFLVVHLKSGCRSGDMGKASGEQGEACGLLRQQVPIIEHWIDSRVHKDFVLLGDFNRTLLTELDLFPKPDKHLACGADLRSRGYRLNYVSTEGNHEGDRHGTLCWN
jgi:hypothetical protein